MYKTNPSGRCSLHYGGGALNQNPTLHVYLRCARASLAIDRLCQEVAHFRLKVHAHLEQGMHQRLGLWGVSITKKRGEK
jgi:hypothetical protein